MYIQYKCTYNIDRLTLGGPQLLDFMIPFACSYIWYVYKIMFATCKYIDICKVTLSSSFSSRLPCSLSSFSPWDHHHFIVYDCHFCFFSIITIHIIVIITTMIIMTGIKVAIVIIKTAPHSDVWARHRYGWREWCMQLFFQWAPQTGQLMQSSKQKSKEVQLMFHCPFLSAKKIQESRYGNIVVLPRNSPKKITIHQSSMAFLTIKLTKFFGLFHYPKKKLTWLAGKSTMNESMYFLLNNGDFCQFSCWFFVGFRGVPPPSCYLGAPEAMDLMVLASHRWSWSSPLASHIAGRCHFCPTKRTQGIFHQQPTERVMCIWWFFGGWEGWCKNFAWIPRMQMDMLSSDEHTQMTQIQNQWAITFHEILGVQ